MIDVYALHGRILLLAEMAKAARYKPGERRTRRDGSVWEGRVGGAAEMVIPPRPRKRRKTAAVEDDEGQKPHHYTLLGIADEVNECELCGKSDLKCTMALRTHDADGNDTGEVYYGRDCGSRALGWTAGPARAEKIIKGEARLTYKELRGSSPDATAALPKTNYGYGLHHRKMAGLHPVGVGDTFPGNVDGAPVLIRIALHEAEFKALKGHGWTQSAYPLVWRFDPARASTREPEPAEPAEPPPAAPPQAPPPPAPVVDSEQIVRSAAGRAVHEAWGTKAGTIVRWEPFTHAMNDVLLREEGGREIWTSMHGLRPADGNGPLPSRHRINEMRDREVAKQLDVIHARLMSDAHTRWPGMEFGKVHLSNAILRAKGETK